MMNAGKYSDMKMRNDIFYNYIKTRDPYYKNMKEVLAKKEHRKASELLWGAITQSIKALASLVGIRIRSHNHFRTFTRQVAKESKDSEYHELFLDLQLLHRHFYDEQFDSVDFPIYLNKANKFINKNDDLIKKKLAGLKK